MLTAHGPQCDVCGDFILGFLPDDTMTAFALGGIEQELLAHTKGCIDKMRAASAANDVTLLPDGPIRKAYEKHAAGAPA